MRAFVRRAVSLVLPPCVAVGVIAAQRAPASAADGPPAWAYPVPNPADNAFVDKDLDTPRHVPGSDRSYTQRQIDSLDPPDWHPESHPVPPPPVLHGRPPNARACGQCHLPIGTGHPESSAIAGQPKDYMFEQVMEFRNGNRKSSVPARSANMIALAKEWSDDEVRAAIDYFAALPRPWWVRVVESATVPETILPGQMRFLKPGGGTEPLGDRIVEFAGTRELSESRDTGPGAGFVAYVPVGSIKKGEDLVSTGGARMVDGKRIPGKTTACISCHGADLKGIDNVPGLVGLHPVYIVRQIYDMQHGTRVGPTVALMQPVIANLTVDDVIDIAAYTASRDPGGPDLRPRAVPGASAGR